MYRTPSELIQVTQVLQNQPFPTTHNNKILGALAGCCSMVATLESFFSWAMSEDEEEPESTSMVFF